MSDFQFGLLIGFILGALIMFIVLVMILLISATGRSPIRQPGSYQLPG